MTNAHVIMLVIGIVTLGLGLTTLLRPSITRSLLGMPDHEATTYILRIGGMMVAAEATGSQSATCSRISAPPGTSTGGGGKTTGGW